MIIYLLLIVYKRHDICNFDDYTNKKLTGIEEIVLMLRCLDKSFDEKTSALKKISKLLHKKEMFDENRFQYFEAVIMLEIRNIIDKKTVKSLMFDLKDKNKVFMVSLKDNI